MSFTNDETLRRELLVEEFRSLRAESSSAKQNQQSIIQWSLAAAGAIGVAAVATSQLQPTNNAAGLVLSTAALGILVPFLIACAFGLWLGETSRMERVGRFLRARESMFMGRAQNVSDPGAVHELPIMWESLIFDDNAKRSYGKNRLGSWAGCALFAGVFFCSEIAAFVMIQMGPPQPLSTDPFHWWATLALVVFAVAFVALFIRPIYRLSASSHGAPSLASLDSFAHRTDLVLPCLNEGPALQWMASRIPRKATVIVADNGSNDGSPALAKAFGFQVEVVPRRLGVGAVSAAGIRRGTAEIVCVLDCDGTIDPQDLAALVTPIEEGRLDFVMGKRQFEPKSASAIHRAMIRARASLLRRRHPDWRWSDIGSARAFRRSALPAGLLESLDAGNGWSLDLALFAVAHLGPARVDEVPIPYRRRIGVSKITGTGNGLIRTFLASLRIVYKYRVGPLYQVEEKRAATRR